MAVTLGGSVAVARFLGMSAEGSPATRGGPTFSAARKSRQKDRSREEPFDGSPLENPLSHRLKRGRSPPLSLESLPGLEAEGSSAAAAMSFRLAAAQVRAQGRAALDSRRTARRRIRGGGL